jgi:outer membrane protein OmpA-like peptidoglycan-associated protein
MRHAIRQYPVVLFILLGLVSGLPLLAQDGKLKLNVYPPETYVFVDGQAVGLAHHILALAPGSHAVGLYNYGFKPETHDVTITSGTTTNLDAKLERVSDDVSGPWGAITIEGANRDAIFLNGKAPEYFVGHGDEFNHDWWRKQELVVPSGSHQLTVVRQGKEIWSGSVEVPANERVVVRIPDGVRKTVSWPRGEKLNSIPRFQAGIASATVAVARPTAQLTAQTQQMNCGDAAQLKWSATDAAHVELTPIGAVAASGEQSVQPKQTTTYQLTVSGPGGTAASSATINVNNAIQADLALSPGEIRYRRVGDRVVEHSSTALNWSAANASTVSIDPLGSVDSSGNRTLQLIPKKADPGDVNETVTYTMTASNACGASQTRTAVLHITGSIAPPEPTTIAINSIYFPTDLPKARRIDAGVARSQQQTLKAVADAFKNFLLINPTAHLMLAGHADQRGPKPYNQTLSERRAQAAKNFLIKEGVPEANIETQGLGEQHNLTAAEVKQLVEQHPGLNDVARKKTFEKIETVTFAHNRRVDLTVSTTGQQSLQQYPFEAVDYAALLKRGGAVRQSEVVAQAGQREKINE